MEILALAVALVALVLALLARAPAASLSRKIEEAASDARRQQANMAQEIEEALALNRRLLARVAAGEGLTKEQILEGQLWREVSPDEGQRMVASGGVRLLDVRTPPETAAGIIPGALRIPIEELPTRLGELPQDGRETLVYCAMGARSAVACELLSQKGIEGLFNLAGGFSSWPGERAAP